MQNSESWQIEVDQEYLDRTVCTSHHRLLGFICMLFGLQSALGMFQRDMEVILATVKLLFALVYLQDIIIFSKLLSEHCKHVCKIQNIFSDAGVTLKHEKSSLFTDTTDYSGHIIQLGELGISTHTCDALHDLIEPCHTTAHRSFLCLCTAFRPLIPIFACIADPLNKMFHKNQSQAFEDLKDAERTAMKSPQEQLMLRATLSLPRTKERYIIDTCTCDKQVGATLLHKQPDRPPNPIGYWSRSFPQAERFYNWTERNCLAVLWTLLLLRPYSK